jgi:hypothetical protein
MQLDAFFKTVRRTIFGGSLTVGQVEGMEKILAYWEETYPRMPLDEMAYVLATIAWETGRRMVPVREGGGERYLRTKKYYPWVGEGLVQVTWETNARKLGAKKPGDLMQWPIALHAAFYGMTTGMFTGKKLSDYIANGRRDYIGARRIINGVDRASEIAKYADDFRIALLISRKPVAPPAPAPAPIPDIPNVPVADYDQFRSWLLKAMAEDPEVRGALLAVVFPDDPEGDPDPMDAPHSEYGPEYDPEYTPEVAYAEEPDARYG